MRRNKRRQQGIVLVAACLCLLLMLAGLGLGVDLNRLLATQSALRLQAEAAALAAALELDGTQAGLERARRKAGTAVTLEFTEWPTGAWQADPLAVDRLTAVRATFSQELPLTLLRSVVRETSIPVRASATAAQLPVRRLDSGLLPFAAQPDGRILNGALITSALEPTAVRLAILNGLAFPVKAGDTLPSPSLRTQPEFERQALNEIIAQDTDAASATYAEYLAKAQGNGRRLVSLPVVDQARRIKSLSGFFLQPADPWRAEPVGGVLLGAGHQAVAATGLWSVEIIP